MVPGKRLPLVEPDAAGARPVFERVGIIGLGLIGGSLALAARRAWPKALVIGVDDTVVLEEAMRRHLIDVAADDPVVLAGADLIVLAAPVEQNVALLDTVATHVPGECGRVGCRRHEARNRRGSTTAPAAPTIRRRTPVGGRRARRHSFRAGRPV